MNQLHYRKMFINGTDFKEDTYRVDDLERIGRPSRCSKIVDRQLDLGLRRVKYFLMTTHYFGR